MVLGGCFGICALNSDGDDPSRPRVGADDERMFLGGDFAFPLAIVTGVAAYGLEVLSAAQHGVIAEHHDARTFRLHAVLHDRSQLRISHWLSRTSDLVGRFTLIQPIKSIGKFVRQF